MVYFHIKTPWAGLWGWFTMGSIIGLMIYYRGNLIPVVLLILALGYLLWVGQYYEAQQEAKNGDTKTESGATTE